MLTTGTAFEEHLARTNVAAQQFHVADAKGILHRSAKGRSRVISDVQDGQTGLLLPLWERKSDQGNRVPAKVIVVGKKGKVRGLAMLEPPSELSQNI